MRGWGVWGVGGKWVRWSLEVGGGLGSRRVEEGGGGDTPFPDPSTPYQHISNICLTHETFVCA